MPLGNTFVAEMKAALLAAGLNIVSTDFDRELPFPQFLVSHAGFLRDRSTFGERVPTCEIQAAVGYVFDVDAEANELVEDTANLLFDVVISMPSVIAFDYNGLSRFEPIDGREAEYFGLQFFCERAGGVRR